MQLKVGEEKTRCLKGSDGSIPSGPFVATSSPTGIVSVTFAGRGAIVKGVAIGSTTVTYTTANYSPASEVYDVVPVPSLVISDTP